MAGELTDSRASLELDVTALNQALMLGIVRQHELTEAAELLNTQLHIEIIARKKVEGALVNSEKLASVGRMAAVLAHEINNPLESVTNLLFLAQMAEGVPDHVRQYLETADGELKRIAQITRQTLGFYREASAPSTFTLASALDSVIDLFQAKRLSAHAVIERQCDSTLNVTAFHGEVRQVLSNFLKNSLDAIADGGRVTLRATLSPGFRDGRPGIRITIADNGGGVNAGSLPQLFTPFFTTKGSIGNGLGLWVSKQLVEKHSGRIQVRSRVDGPRKGTTFSILLPISTLA
jgi:two-component system, NtrC family, sensor kinase